MSRSFPAALGLAAIAMVAFQGRARADFLPRNWPWYHHHAIDSRGHQPEPLAAPLFLAAYDEDTVLYLLDQGVLRGYEGKPLAEDTVLSRLEAAFLVGRWMEAANRGRRPTFTRAHRGSVPLLLVPHDSWAREPAVLALQEGLVRTFKEKARWDAPLTRYELASISARALKALARTRFVYLYFRGEPRAQYQDLYFAPGWVYPRLRLALRSGVVEGAGPDRFGGKDFVRGHELARTLRRLLIVAREYSSPVPD